VIEGRGRGTKYGDAPRIDRRAFRTKPSRPQSRNQAGTEQRRLPAPGITDDRENPGAPKPIQQVGDFGVASEKQPGGLRFEGLQAAERAVAAPVVCEQALLSCERFRFLHRGHKPIPLPGYGLDESVAVAVVSQGLPQDKDVLAEISFLDKALRPERCHQFIFFENSATALNQERQGIEHFRRKRYRLAVAHQYPLREIELKSAELVDQAELPNLEDWVDVRL